MIWYILPLLLFRVFVIFKPFPVKQLQNLPGGWGVMADDVMAGFMANVSTRVIIGVLIGVWS